MSLSDIWFLYRARLRAGTVLVQEGFAIAGIAVGVALLFASQVAATSLTHSISTMTRQIVGNTQLQLDARGPDGFSEGLLAHTRALPGVRVALPVLEMQGTLTTAKRRQAIDLIGADPRFAHFAGPLLQRFSAKQLATEQAVALPSSMAQELKVGPLEAVNLQIGARIASTIVGAVLTEADIGELSHSPVVVAPVRYVQSISGMRGRVTRIYVQVIPGHEAEARQGLGQLAASAHVNLEPANFDVTLFSVAAAPATQGQTLFSAISALVGFMFALNAMLMTAPSRRRLIEDVRRQGATRLMVVQLMLFDAAVLGVLACVLGLALGDVLSIAVFHTTPGYLSFAFPIGNTRTVTWASVGLSLICGFLAAAWGVFWPLRDTLAAPFGGRWRAHAQSGHSSRARLALGMAGIALTVAIVRLRPASAVLGCFVLVFSLVCLLPALFDWIVSGFDRVQRLLAGASALLAVTELRTPQTRIRSLAIAATGAIALFGVIAVHGAQVNLANGLHNTTRGIDAGADMWILPSGGSDPFLTVPFHAIDIRAVARLPGVAAVGRYEGSFLNWGDRRVWVRGIPPMTREPVPPEQLVAGNLAAADVRIRQGGWAVVSKALASEHGLRIGDTFLLAAPRPIELKVAAMSTNFGWSPGAVILSATDYSRAWGSEDPSAYEVQLRPGTQVGSVTKAIRDMFPAASGLTVETTGERDVGNDRIANQGLSRLSEIRTLILIAAVLAVTGAMGAMIWQRRDLVAFIKCQGYREGVLWRWLMCECGLLLAVGCAVGSVFGLFGQLLLSHALASVTGFPIALHVGATIALASFAVVTVAAAAIVAIAGYLVVRVRPRTVSPAY